MSVQSVDLFDFPLSVCVLGGGGGGVGGISSTLR